MSQRDRTNYERKRKREKEKRKEEARRDEVNDAQYGILRSPWVSFYLHIWQQCLYAHVYTSEGRLRLLTLSTISSYCQVAANVPNAVYLPEEWPRVSLSRQSFFFWMSLRRKRAFFKKSFICLRMLSNKRLNDVTCNTVNY